MKNSRNILYKWQYEDNKNRSPLWYMIFFSITIGIVIWGFLTQQYGLSIVIMLVAGFFYFLENNSEDEVSIQITDLGIKVQGNFYDYSKVGGYSLVYNDDRAVMLRLIIKKRGVGILNLNIDNTIASDIRHILSQYIEENEKQEISFLDRIIQLLKL